jgi:hypothetical protein
LLVQGKDSNAALPLHPHPAPVYHDGKIQAVGNYPLSLSCVHRFSSRNFKQGRTQLKRFRLTPCNSGADPSHSQAHQGSPSKFGMACRGGDFAVRAKQLSS